MAIEFNLGEPISEFVEKLNELSEEVDKNINPNEISAGVTSTSTLSAGASATASAAWSEANKKINFTFGIPKGAKGDKGNTGEKGDTGDKGDKGDPGEKGDKGDDGTSVAVSSTSVTYQTSSNGVSAPTGTWTTAIPTVNNGQYLWTRTIVNYSDGKSTTSYAVGYKGTNGTNGTTPTIKSANGSNIGSVGTPSVTASTSGTTTTFTFNYLKGAKGDKGDKGDTGVQGVKGDTGEKGDSGTPIFVNSIEEMVDPSKTYVLLSDGYIYSTSAMKTYTNLANPESNEWLTDTRINSSATTSCPGAIVTNFIPAKYGDVVRIKGIDLTAIIGGSYPKIAVMLNGVRQDAGGVDVYAMTNNGTAVVDGDTTTMIFNSNADGDWENIKEGNFNALRFCGTLLGDAKDVVITVNEEIIAKGYTNQVPISIDVDGSIFNGKGWIDRTRLSSTGVTKANDFTSTTGYIPALSGAIVRIKATAWDNGADYICTYNSSFGFLTALSGQGAYGGGEIISRDGGVTTIRLPSNNNIAYIRVSALHSSADEGYASVATPIEGPGSYMIVTVNEEIKEGATTIGFTNTGLKYGIMDYDKIGAQCTTAAGTAAKVVTPIISGALDNFVLAEGATVTVKMTNSHTSTSDATLNVNNTGAKTIYAASTWLPVRHTATYTASYQKPWKAGAICTFRYDGTNWVWMNAPRQRMYLYSNTLYIYDN